MWQNANMRSSLWITVILLILLVQLFQTCGTKLAIRSDKRLKNKSE